MKIGIIGAGNMGGAMFFALAESKFHHQACVCDQDFGKLKKLGENFHTDDFENIFFTDADDMAQKSDILILAIKPQSFEDFSKSVNVDFSQKLLLKISLLIYKK